MSVVILQRQPRVILLKQTGGPVKLIKQLVAGPKGDTGATGATGAAGQDGTDGVDGQDGLNAIGVAIAGGVAGRDLFVGPGNVLAQDDGTVALTTGPRVLKCSGVGSGNSGLAVRTADGASNVIRVHYDALGSTSLDFFNTLTGLKIATVGFLNGVFAGIYLSDLFVAGLSRMNQGIEVGSFADAKFSGRLTSYAGRPLVMQAESGQETVARANAANAVALTLQNVTANGGGTLRSAPLPAAVSADQNNWNPGVAMFVDVTSSGALALNISGIGVGQVDGQVMYIRKVAGTPNIQLLHESALSTASNRVTNETKATIVMGNNALCMLVYSASNSRWTAYPSKTCT